MCNFSSGAAPERQAVMNGRSVRKAIRRFFFLSAMAVAFPAIAMGFGSGLEICVPPVEPAALVDPTVVADCSEAGLRAALEGGGHITFDCGPGPMAIPISAELRLSATADTVIDGQGLITLDGGNRTRIFFKDWHDPDTVGTISVTLQNIRIINAKAPGGDNHSGGALYAGHPGTRVRIINATFENNATTDIHTVDNQGGAVFVHNAFETVMSGSEFINNRAGNGGAFGGIATGLFVFNSRFSGNAAVDDAAGGVVRGHGGAIHLDGVTNDYNPDSNKRVHICGSIFEDNASVRGGGALKVTVADNKGIRATYEKSSFVNNSASGASGVEGHGGALYHLEDDHDRGDSEFNVEISDCAFIDNSGWKQGGGAWLYALGKIEVVNSTFAGNRVTDDGGMGGGLVLSLGEAAVTNCTFARNYAWFHGGGIQAAGGAAVSLQNDLFYYNESVRDWGNYQMNRTADADGGGNLQFPGERFNQIGTPDDGKVTPTAVVADPLLEDPADNGGPTPTMALTEGSPAIDAGTAAGTPAEDQRGIARDDRPDIGAFEFTMLPDLADVVAVLRVCAGMAVNPGPHVADVDGDDAIGLAEAVHLFRMISEF